MEEEGRAESSWRWELWEIKGSTSPDTSLWTSEPYELDTDEVELGALLLTLLEIPRPVRDCELHHETKSEELVRGK